MPLVIDYHCLSPFYSNSFPCWGAHRMFRNKNDDVPYCYALRVGIVKTSNVIEMLVKIPYLTEQRPLYLSLVNQLKENPNSTIVSFENLKTMKYIFPDKVVFSGTADIFKLED